MPVDPTHPDSFEDFLEEEAAEAEPDDAPAGAGYETPLADAAEQRRDLLRQRREPLAPRGPVELGEADPADAAEQRRTVERTDDEGYDAYR